MALEAGNLNSKQLLAGLRVPDSDVVKTASCKKLRVAGWEGDIIDFFVVTGVSELRGDVVSVAPIDG